jgi:type VI secretion system secreted protein Hcp
MKRSILILAALLLAVLPTRAVDMFLKVTDVPGESVAEGHKDEIELLSYSFGVSNTSTVTSGGAGAGKAVFQSLNFAKRIDKSTTPLMLACAQGKHIPEAILTLSKPAGDKPFVFMRITLNDIIVSSIASSGAAGSEILTESVSFNYSKIKVEYFQQRADGSVILAGAFSWNLLTGTQL